MNIAKNNCVIINYIKDKKIFNDEYDKKFALFVLTHVIVWTLSPLLVRNHIGTDMAEHFVWGQEFQLGYYKHPPLSAWIVGLWFKIFPTNNFFFFLLGQLNITLGFLYIYKLSKEILGDSKKAYIATIILELLVWYSCNQTWFNAARNFNHDTILLFVWPMCTYYLWISIKTNLIYNWGKFSISCAICFLSKYFSIVFFIGILFFLFKDKYVFKNKIKLCLASIVVLLFLYPHLYWIYENLCVIKYIDKYISKNYIYDLCSFIFIHLIILMPSFFIALKMFNLRFYQNKNDYVLFSFILIPFIFTILIALTKKYSLLPRFGMPLWFLFGTFIVSYATEITKENIKKIEKIVYGYLFFWLIISIIMRIFTIPLGSKEYYFFPVNELSQKITQEWHQNYNTHLKNISGDGFTPDYISFLSKDHPSVLIGLNYQISPWMNEEKIKNEGIAIVCYSKREPDCLQRVEKIFSWTKINWKKEKINNYDFDYTFIPPQNTENERVEK